MRSGVAILSFVSVLAAVPAVAADMPESYYERHGYRPAPVERETVVEEPRWREEIVEEEPIEERVIVRRPPPVVIEEIGPRWRERPFYGRPYWRGEGRYGHWTRRARW